MKVSEFILATQNPNKLAEFKLFLSDSLDIYPLHSLESLPGPIESPEETGSTFEENARLKALYYSSFCPKGCCVIAEDSGLSVDSLDGAPGVYSSRFSGEAADDEKNIDKLLRLLDGIQDRHACFMTVIALACKDQVITTFTGIVHGQISLERKGENGFGYDPVFYYPPLRKCFAQLSPEEKNQVSHRAKAMLALRHFLLQMTDKPDQ